MNGRNDPHTTTAVTATQLAAISQQLQIWHEQLKIAEALVRASSDGFIAVHAWKSSSKGMQIFKAFMDALEASRMRMAMGQPMAVGERKPRSRDKADAMIDELRASHGVPGYSIVAENKPTKKAPKKKG
jgi:N-acetyl-beta-hexosaminidase